MDNRELYISTTGQMIRYMTDSRIEDVLDDVYGYASDADYYGAASAFLADTETCYANGISKDQYNYDTETGKTAVTIIWNGMRSCWRSALRQSAAARRWPLCSEATVFTGKISGWLRTLSSLIGVTAGLPWEIFSRMPC